MSKTWTIDNARHAYAIEHWSNGYVDVDAGGDLQMRPRGAHGPSLSLPKIVRHARNEGLRLPLLLRFTDILTNRLGKLQDAFAKATQAHHYQGSYTAIYPIKVNQQEAVVSELVAVGGENFGLEAGSKPELMAVLGMALPGSIVICNGYKDRQYIRLALIGRKLGLRIYLVIEKPSELDDIISESKLLDVEPLLGVRVRLSTVANGNWQNTGGSKGKFGLSSVQVLHLLKRLQKAGLTHTLKLQHFHMGSQISDIKNIEAGMREATRFFVELSHMGVPLDSIDVGGGLGVDYEGSRSRSFNSINYSIGQYATTIVRVLADAVKAEGMEAPRILTEAGRAMTAHHAVLIVNVSGVETVPEGAMPPAHHGEPKVLQHLRKIHDQIDKRPPTELYHEAQHYLREGQTLYALGQLRLTERATLEEMHYAIANALHSRFMPGNLTHRQILDDLDATLLDKYFVNFSVFESVPDIWAIKQIFPIVPIAQLHEKPTQRGVIVDLTCDSDGRIDHYVGAEGMNVSMPLHAIKSQQHYCLGIFMVGAYQEILGDIHNLFGDTDAVNVRLCGDSYTFTSTRRGDSTDLLLDYVGYDLAKLRIRYDQRIAAAKLESAEANHYHRILEESMSAYTYRSEEDTPHRNHT